MSSAQLRSPPSPGAVAETAAIAGKRATLAAVLWKSLGLFLLALWVIGVRYRSFDLGVSNPDESLFILIGQAWLTGHLPYVAIWDVKPPGLFLLFAIAQWLVGPGILAARVLTAAAVFAGSLALFRFGRRHFADAWVAPSAAFLYPTYTVILYGLRSSPEILLAPLVILALDLALTERNSGAGGRGWRVVLAGLLLGFAVMIKQTAGFESLLAAGLIGIRVPGFGRAVSWKPLAKFIAAGALPSAVFLAYFALSGAAPALYLTPFIGAASRLHGDGISFGAGVLRFLPMCKPILPLLAGGLLLAAERRALLGAPDAAGVRALYLWITASAAGAVAMRSMYFPYFMPLVAPLLIASLLVLRTWLAGLARPTAKFALTFALLTIVGGYPLLWFTNFEAHDAGASHLPAEAARAMHEAGLGPTDTVYVVDQETTIYLFAGARLPTRYIQSDHLVCDFTLSGTTPDAEIRRIMASAPRFVVVTHARRWMVCERPDRVAIVDDYLTRDYTLLTTLGDNGQSVDIYRRNRAPAAPGPSPPGSIPPAARP
jgi:4-amino-4-deoxy-L-arabinose transferase-like glycosyltransferase